MGGSIYIVYHQASWRGHCNIKGIEELRGSNESENTSLILLKRDVRFLM